jgi:DNA-binding GntR family transcriptional regulator
MSIEPASLMIGQAMAPIRRAKTTAEEVEERLIIAIALGEKQPGERLTEADVSSALAVSRVPAREAMQKLQVRGILVEQGLRGLRVADYSPRRIAELIELRFAIERIFFQHVMCPEFDRAPLIAALELMLGEMRALSGTGDSLAVSMVDLEFHRTIAVHSGNQLATQIWEGLAQHMLIVFCRDWSQATDRTGEVELHNKLVAFLRAGDLADLDAVLSDHFNEPSKRVTIETRGIHVG